MRDEFTLPMMMKEKPMRLIMNLGRTFTLVAVLGLTLSAVGCGGGTDTEETGADTTPSTDLGEEAGSNTGGGAETPATE